VDRRLLIDVLLVVVIVIGIANFFVPLLVHGFVSDPIVTGTFMGIAGVLLTGKGVFEKFSQGDKKDKKAGHKE